MELAGIGKWGIPENRFTYNAQSEKQKDLNGGKGYFYETDYRGYDPQIGRFHQYEPLADFYSGISPYQFAFNNPISGNDPTGLYPDDNDSGTCPDGNCGGSSEPDYEPKYLGDYGPNPPSWLRTGFSSGMELTRDEGERDKVGDISTNSEGQRVVYNGEQWVPLLDDLVVEAKRFDDDVTAGDILRTCWEI